MTLRDKPPIFRVINIKQLINAKIIYNTLDFYQKNDVICDLFYRKYDQKTTTMARVCQITGKKVMVGNNVSHSKRRTKRTFQPNLFDKKFYLADEDRWVSLKVSAAGIRIINKKGLKGALNDAVSNGLIQKY